jgi:hypothetical protein
LLVKHIKASLEGSLSTAVRKMPRKELYRLLDWHAIFGKALTVCATILEAASGFKSSFVTKLHLHVLHLSQVPTETRV